MRAWFRGAWEALGRPPWYVWPLLIVPAILASWWLSHAAIFLTAGVVLLVIDEMIWGLVALALAAVSVFGEIESKGW